LHLQTGEKWAKIESQMEYRHSKSKAFLELSHTGGLNMRHLVKIWIFWWSSSLNHTQSEALLYMLNILMIVWNSCFHFSISLVMVIRGIVTLCLWVAVGFMWAMGVVAAVAVVQEIVAEPMILPTWGWSTWWDMHWWTSSDWAKIESEDWNGNSNI